MLQSFAELLAGGAKSIGDGVDGPIEAGGKVVIGSTFEVLGSKKLRVFIVESGEGRLEKAVAFPVKKESEGIEGCCSSGF